MGGGERPAPPPTPSDETDPRGEGGRFPVRPSRGPWRLQEAEHQPRCPLRRQEAHWQTQGPDLEPGSAGLIHLASAGLPISPNHLWWGGGGGGGGAAIKNTPQHIHLAATHPAHFFTLSLHPSSHYLPPLLFSSFLSPHFHPSAATFLHLGFSGGLIIWRDPPSVNRKQNRQQQANNGGKQARNSQM